MTKTEVRQNFGALENEKIVNKSCSLSILFILSTALGLENCSMADL